MTSVEKAEQKLKKLWCLEAKMDKEKIKMEEKHEKGKLTDEKFEAELEKWKVKKKEMLAEIRELKHLIRENKK